MLFFNMYGVSLFLYVVFPATILSFPPPFREGDKNFFLGHRLEYSLVLFLTFIPESHSENWFALEGHQRSTL